MQNLKRKEYNSLDFLSHSLNININDSRSFKGALEGALRNNEFSVVYQPKFEISSGNYIGAEALIRWKSKSMGGVSPGVFIPMAERFHLITEIDKWMISAVCRQLRAWSDIGDIENRIAINVSAEFIGDPSFSAFLEQAASAHSVDMSKLEIEITETSALRNLDVVKANIESIRKKSTTVAMDDFGAGHSSLQLLLHCQIDSLKIDKSLIDEIDRSYKGVSVVSSLISLSKILNLKAVAEGVETESQLRILQNVKCDIAQGFFLAKEMNAEKLVESIDIYTSGPCS